MTGVDLFHASYKPISISSLEKNSAPPFDIYIKVGKEYVLFLSKHKIFSEESITRLNEKGADILYINKNDEKVFEKYCDAVLEKYSKDSPEVLEKKSIALYSSAKSVMNRIFTQAISKKEIVDAKDTALGMLKQIGSDRSAFLSLMRVSSHDYYTYTHSINVCMYAIAIGSELKLPPEDMKLLAEGALLHDVGKSKIDSSIINKEGPLTQEEFEAMKNHPTYGMELLLKNGETNVTILHIVGEHHEKLNGKGYPKGLDSAHIAKLAQIVTIADIFDALTTKRSYKEALTSFEAFSLMLSKMKEELNVPILERFITGFKA